MVNLPKDQIPTHTFTLIFPQWDLVTVILCVVLLSYMYGEGKSNYFKVCMLLGLLSALERHLLITIYRVPSLFSAISQS